MYSKNLVFNSVYCNFPEMATNPVDDTDENRDESKVKQENTVDTNSLTIEESGKGLKPDFSLIEPSTLKNKMTTSTPRRKFISGF